MKKILVSVAAASLCASAFSAGFGLYETSARGVGMGNGLVGSTGDASANYYNPANLTECTNVQVMVGMSLINPFCDVKVDGKYQSKMNPGWFPPPHAYISTPVWGDRVFFGFGTYCEYGLGTKYDNNWDLNYDTTETTIEQFTFNPNVAFKITEDWSFAFGARMSYMTFENFKTPLDALPSQINSQLGQLDAYGRQSIRTHLEGDDFSCGYMLATQYKVNDDLKLGLVYRSRINHTVEGDFNASGHINSMVTQMTGGKVAVPPSGSAKAKVVLPSSLTFGANYDFTDKFRGGAALTWTEWSTINHIDFNLPAGVTKQDLNWHDAWRLGFGFEYDFTKSFIGRIGYSYDWDPSGEAHGTTMLPPGDRHIVGFGVGYKFLDNWRIDLGYNFIIMESESRMISDETGFGRPPKKMQCDNSYSHIVSASVSYSF